MSKRQEVQTLATIAIIENEHNLALDISPRVGKSKILIDAIQDKEDWNIYIASPYETIKNSWNEEIEHWGLGFKPELICFKSLNKIPDNLELLVIDEFQVLSMANYKTIMKKKPKRIICLSGTVSFDTQMKLKSLLGIEVKFRYSIEQAIEDGIISSFKIKIINCELDNKKLNVKSGTTKNPFMSTELGHYTFISKAYETYKVKSRFDAFYYNLKMSSAAKRSRFLAESETKVKIAEGILSKLNRALIFTGSTEQADNFCDSYHSKNKKLDNLTRFINLEIDKLAVVNMANMGITIPKLKHAIIHQMQSSSEMSLQKILRMCNLEDEEEAVIYVLCYKNTIDIEWIKSALENVSPKRIEYIDYVDLKIENVSEIMRQE